MHKERKHRTAASLTAAILLSVTLFLLFFCIELLAGYFSPRLFRESLRVSDYGTDMEKEMIQKQKELFASYGLPESLTDEIWEENEAYLAFYKFVDGGNAEDGSQFGQQEVLGNYLKGQDIYETESVTEASEILLAESKAICARYLYPSFITEYRQLISGKKIFLIVTAVISAALSVMLIILLFRWYRSRHHALRFVIGGMFTAAVWNLAGTYAVWSGDWFPTKGIVSESYQKFLDVYFANGLRPWYIVSTVAVGMTILLGIVFTRMRNHEL